MRTDSPKFPDTYAFESTFSKRQMAESIEVFFKKILYKKYVLLIFFLILLYQNFSYKMKCKCLLELSDLLKETFALIWWHCLLHSYPLSHSSCKHLSFDLKPNQDKFNFISAFFKLTILTGNNVQFLIMNKARKRLFPTFVQTLVLNMTFFCTVFGLIFMGMKKFFFCRLCLHHTVKKKVMFKTKVCTKVGNSLFLAFFMIRNWTLFSVKMVNL